MKPEAWQAILLSMVRNGDGDAPSLGESVSVDEPPIDKACAPAPFRLRPELS